MKGFSFFVARRFLFSPKSHSVINVISRVSMVAVGIPVAAMIILMGVFSGLEGLIKEMYGGFDPDLTVRVVEGKVFEAEALDVEAVRELEGIERAEFVLEDNALVEYRGRQTTVTVRGEDSRVSELSGGGAEGAVVGQGVAYELGIRLGFTEQLSFWVPRRGSFSALLPMSAFSTGQVSVTGIFMLDAQTDGEYVFVPLEFARELFDYPGQASGLTLELSKGTSVKRVEAQVEGLVGEEFEVLDRREQREGMYRIMRLEKWGVFFVGLLVLIIASLSIAGSLVMLIIDKRPGIATLEALGASRRLVRRIFIEQGMMIGAIGALAGLVLGVVVCGAQQIFGVVPMPGGTFLVESYPVKLRWVDLAMVCTAFVVVVWIITTFTVRKTIK